MIALEDLENKDFKKSGFRGYNTDEVDYFIQEVITAHKHLSKENEELRKKVNQLTETMQYYQKMEQTIQNALHLAEKTAQDTKISALHSAQKIKRRAEDTVANMKKEAEAKAALVNRLAEERAQSVLTKAVDVLTKQQAEVNELRNIYNNYKNQIKDFMAMQLQILEETGKQLEEDVLNAATLNSLALENIIIDHIEEIQLTEQALANSTEEFKEEIEKVFKVTEVQNV
ncbi:MAG: hypothetical protein ATN33_04100 [Epulopiscium sp. Nele67-Bin001]|nr:MAG: hypothetical protein BEN18_01735 [Epulopiscium sp. Nuni2H_MBin001]OON94660.1 MAG: hypothetical protein ATN33_04100 [Epulopiscium sp. Nele67-Bin001]